MLATASQVLNLNPKLTFREILFGILGVWSVSVSLKSWV